MPNILISTIKIAACVALVSLVLSDLRYRRLPNIAVATLAGLYCIQAILGVSDAAAFIGHALTGAAAFAAGALLFRLGCIAGGDVKLAAVVFLWAGPAHSPSVLFIVSVCGLVLGLVMIAAGALLRRVADAPRWLSSLAPSRGVPYGAALALGGAAAVWAPLASMPQPPVA